MARRPSYPVDGRPIRSHAKGTAVSSVPRPRIIQVLAASCFPCISIRFPGPASWPTAPKLTGRFCPSYGDDGRTCRRKGVGRLQQPRELYHRIDVPKLRGCNYLSFVRTICVAFGDETCSVH
jgi:hypothetical protein